MSIRPTFYGLEIAKTGLFISQKGLDVTGHNIANVDTAGYTRQRLNLQSIDPYNASFKMKPLTRGLIGGGVQIQMVEQIRNLQLDRQFRTQQSTYSRWATRTTGLGYLESLFDDSNDSGVNAAIMSLFNAFDDLTHSSSDEEHRTITYQAAITLMASMKSTYDSMVTQLTVQNESIKGVADQINSIIDSIAILNESIYRFESNSDMQKANDLRDKRNLLLDELSALVNIDYKETSEGKLIVSTNGIEIVNHTSVNKIECNQVTNPVTGEDDLWQLSLFTGNMVANPAYNAVSDPNSLLYNQSDPAYSAVSDPSNLAYDPSDPAYDPVSDPTSSQYSPTIPEMRILSYENVGGGELKGHLELRDNGTDENPGIPYFIEQLNNLTRALVQEINAQHQKGYTHPNGGSSVQGVNFFDDFGNIDLVTAGNMAFSSDLANGQIWNIACSSTEIDLDSADTAKAGNQENALALTGLIDSTRLTNNGFGVTSFNGFILGMTATYTSTTHHSKTQTDTLSIEVLSIDNNRLSVSGVSLDEEMTNLIRYQHAYQGASRVITAMDEALEMLINRMGLVGRS